MLVAALAAATACSDSPAPIEPEPTPTGPLPEIHASVQFGDSPVEGALYLLPEAGTEGWTYAIDLDEDGEADREGILERRIGFDYRFDAPGTHLLRIDLTGPTGTETAEVPVVVNRPDAVRIVGQTTIETDADEITFEGIVVSPDGSTVYAGNFRGGDIHAIDAHTLEKVASVDLWYGVEALTISPSGDYLLPAFKNSGSVRLRLPELAPEFARRDYAMFAHWGHAVDDRHLLATGGLMALHDVVAGTPERFGQDPSPTGQFDVDPKGGRVLGVEWGEATGLHMVSLPDLGVTRTYPQPPGLRADRVVFGPGGERAYVLAIDERDPDLAGWRLLVIDLSTGETVRSLSLDTASCSIYCAANPVARSREGRYVAFETSEGVLIVDTTTDLPIGRGPHMSVAASPVEDATFWTLRIDGLLSKIVVEP